MHLAVGRLVTVKGIGVIKEPGRDDHAAFLIDNREAPFAHALVDAINAQFELGFAALGNRGGALAAAGGADAVLVALAVRVKRREQLPVVLFYGAEVAIDDGNQAFALPTLLRRQYFLESRIVRQFRRVAERRRVCRRTLDHGFDFRDLSVRNFQPQGQEGAVAMLLHRAVPGDIARRRIRDFKSRGRDAAHRTPQPLAKRHLHIVFRVARIARKGRQPTVLMAQGIQVAVQNADQAAAIAVRVYRTGLTGGLRPGAAAGRHRDQQRRGAQTGAYAHGQSAPRIGIHEGSIRRSAKALPLAPVRSCADPGGSPRAGCAAQNAAPDRGRSRKLRRPPSRDRTRWERQAAANSRLA